MPQSTKDQLLEALMKTVRSAGPLGAFLVIFTVCSVGFWRYAGKEMVSLGLQGMEIGRDITVAQAKASEAALRTVELAAEVLKGKPKPESLLTSNTASPVQGTGF